MFIKKAKTTSTNERQELLFVAGNMPFALATMKRCQASGQYQFSDAFLDTLAEAIVTNLNQSFLCQHRGTYFGGVDQKSKEVIVSHLKSALETFYVSEKQKTKLASREDYLKRELVGKASGGTSLYSTITGSGVKTTSLSSVYYHRSVSKLMNILCHFISSLLSNTKDNPLSTLTVQKGALSSEEIDQHVRELVSTTVKEVLEKSAVSVILDDQAHLPRP